MGAVAKLKAAVGLSTSPVEVAQAKVAAARAEHERMAGKVDDLNAEIGRLTKAFEVEPTDSLADQVVALRAELAKRQLYADRAAALLRAAERALADASQAEREAKLVALDEQADSARVRESVTQLWATRGKAAVLELAAIHQETERIISDARTAAHAAATLRGESAAIALTSIPPVQILNGLYREMPFDLRRAVADIVE